MKLRNKKTGEIQECSVIPIIDGYVNEYEVFEKAGSLTELNENWEDYEGPKIYWYVDEKGTVFCEKIGEYEHLWHEAKRAIGNYFETKEEAEKAVEKLKAWKRLKDKGFKFTGVKALDYAVDFEVNSHYTHIALNEYTATEEQKEFLNDLMFLFGGEE